MVQSSYRCNFSEIVRGLPAPQVSSKREQWTQRLQATTSPLRRCARHVDSRLERLAALLTMQKGNASYIDLHTGVEDEEPRVSTDVLYIEINIMNAVTLAKNESETRAYPPLSFLIPS